MSKSNSVIDINALLVHLTMKVVLVVVKRKITDLKKKDDNLLCSIRGLISKYFMFALLYSKSYLITHNLSTIDRICNK